MCFVQFSASKTVDIESFLKFFRSDGSAAVANLSPVRRRVRTLTQYKLRSSVESLTPLPHHAKDVCINSAHKLSCLVFDSEGHYWPLLSYQGGSGFHQE